MNRRSPGCGQMARKPLFEDIEDGFLGVGRANSPFRPVPETNPTGVESEISSTKMSSSKETVSIDDDAPSAKERLEKILQIPRKERSMFAVLHPAIIVERRCITGKFTHAIAAISRLVATWSRAIRSPTSLTKDPQTTQEKHRQNPQRISSTKTGKYQPRRSYRKAKRRFSKQLSNT